MHLKFVILLSECDDDDVKGSFHVTALRYLWVGVYEHYFN
jgi:hypothetical protein